MRQVLRSEPQNLIENNRRFHRLLVDGVPVSYQQGDRTAQDHLADMLKDWITDNNPLADQASVYSDLLTAALDQVDWMEMADKFLDE